jgi:flagellar protein FliJ
MHALNTLLERAAAERDQALAALRQADDAAGRQQAQHAQLAAYRVEYQQRWAGQFRQGGAIEIMHCYQSFMQRLDEALAQQQRLVDTAAGAALRARETLLARETRVASVRKLIERRAAEHQRSTARREQRQTDESAQQASWRANHGSALSSGH